jgi:antitoxin component of MazEF toxin-antitoxin module
MPEPRSVTFETTVQQTGNNTGIVVPPEKMSALGAGGRPQVLVEVNGYQYRSAVGMMGGKHMVSVSAAVRKATDLKGDDDVRVTLTVAESPREVEIPDDLQTAFAVNGAARAFFATLSNSLQRYHIDNINAAKTAETRQRRIEKSIGLFLAGKKR